MDTFYSGARQQIDTVGNAVKLIEHNSCYAGLYYEFRTFQAG